MLARRREQIIVLLGLLALNVGFGWLLSRDWEDYRARTQWIHARRSAEPGQVGEPLRAPSTAQNFADIVDHTIFRPERAKEASVASDAVKLPELPLLYGSMDLAEGKFALMAPGDQANAPSRPVRVGEKIGGYNLVSIRDSQVDLEWGEKRFTVDVWESARRVPRVVEKSAPPPRPADSSSMVKTTVTTGASSSAAPVAVGGAQAKTGFVGFHAPADATADAPVGTVIAGKRKVMHMTLFGPTYTWEDVEPPQNTSPQNNPPKEN